MFDCEYSLFGLQNAVRDALQAVDMFPKESSCVRPHCEWRRGELSQGHQEKDTFVFLKAAWRKTLQQHVLGSIQCSLGAKTV